MTELNIRLDLRPTPRVFRGVFAVMLLSGLAGELASESVTLTTYYPAASGVYSQLIVTQNSFFSRDAGCLEIGTAAIAAVPIGTAKLVVMNGAVSVGTTNPDASFGTAAPAELSVFGLTGGNVDLMVNGRMRTGDAGLSGGIWLNNPNTQFVGQIADTTGGTHFALQNNGIGLTVATNGAVGVGNMAASATFPASPMDVVGDVVGRGWTITNTVP